MINSSYVYSVFLKNIPIIYLQIFVCMLIKDNMKACHTIYNKISLKTTNYIIKCNLVCIQPRNIFRE